MDPLVRLKNATIGYHDRPVLVDVQFELRLGEWVAVLGPNGSGKSLLIRCLLGEIPLLSGECQRHQVEFGYVSQHFSVAPFLPISVAEFLQLAEKKSNSELKAFRQSLVERLGLAAFFDQRLSAISGGQLQRALLAFALWNKPNVLLLDEYRKGLDQHFDKMVVGILQTYFRDHQIAIVEVSHDTSSVQKDCSRVILVQGGISYDGPPSGVGFHSCLHHLYPNEHLMPHQGDETK